LRIGNFQIVKTPFVDWPLSIAERILRATDGVAAFTVSPATRLSEKLAGNIGLRKAANKHPTGDFVFFSLVNF